MALDARQQWPERSWEMRWYRQHARELLRHESPDLVALADDKVAGAAAGDVAAGRVPPRPRAPRRGARLSGGPPGAPGGGGGGGDPQVRGRPAAGNSRRRLEPVIAPPRLLTHGRSLPERPRAREAS